MNKPSKNMEVKRICEKCKRKIKDREDYISIVDDKDWNPFENAYDLLTKKHMWHFYHKECK